MPLQPHETFAYRRKRIEASLRIVGIFVTLTVAAIMVFFVTRLVAKRLDNSRKARVGIESERENFEQNVASTRSAREDAGARPGPREIVPNTDVVDMTARSSPTSESPFRSRDRWAAGASSGKTQPEVAPVREPAGIEHIEQKQAAMAEVLREFFAARNISAMLPVVRSARRVRPLMEDYYRRNPIRDRSWSGIGWAIPVEEPGYRFAYVQATFNDAPPLNVVVEETDTGFYIDWESSVQYSEMSWREFVATKPAQPKMFRIIATKAEGDAGRGGGLLSLKHPQEEGVVVGRFDPKDPRFRLLVEQLDLCKWKDVPVILRLSYPNTAATVDEVQIVGVEGKGWLVLGDRFRGS